MLEQRDALLRLLEDDDPATVDLVKGQLATRGAEQLAELRELLTGAGHRSAQQLREVIASIEARDADAVFTEICAHFGEHGDLEAAAWSLAATFFPGIDFTPQRQQLEAWAAEVTRRLAKAPTPLDRIETLVEYLGHEVRLRGNAADYYNITNSLLSEVIETRLGIPITLSLVYLLVARRAGLSLDGVCFPGHFIVRSGDHFFDPFHGGRRLGLDDCRALLEPQNLALDAAHLQPATPREILRRIVLNLFAIARSRDPALAQKLARWIELLAPHRG